MASIPLTMRATTSGRVRTSGVTLRVSQRQYGSCGDYGGLGYASVDWRTDRLVPTSPTP